MSTYACWQNIIGISRTECQCVEDKPVDASVSASGIFLDELPGLPIRFIDAVRDCGQDSLWDFAERAIENAVGETKAEVMGCVNRNTEPAKRAGQSEIGSGKKATTGETHPLSKPFHGITVQTDNMRGGYFRVTAIATAFKGDALPATIDVKLYKDESESSGPEQTITLPVTSNKVEWTVLPTPIELSMSSLGDRARYWFLFEPIDGMRAMNTLTGCNCGGFNPYWNLHTPQWMSKVDKGRDGWANWAQAQGTSGDDLLNRENWQVFNPTHGIMLRVQFECDESSTICAETPNYTGDMFQLAFAHAVRYRAAFNLATSILNSTKIDRYTMTAGDQLEKMRQEWHYEWLSYTSGPRKSDGTLERAGYLCEQLSKPENVNLYGDCRKCADQWGMRRSTIRN